MTLATPLPLQRLSFFPTTSSLSSLYLLSKQAVQTEILGLLRRKKCKN